MHIDWDNCFLESRAERLSKKQLVLLKRIALCETFARSCHEPIYSFLS